MKFCIIHPDATGRFDPPGVDSIRQIPNRVDSPNDGDVLLIPVARFDGFRFDEKLNDIQKPWVLFDWCEFGWDNPMETSYLWGKNRLSHSSFQNEEWEKFDRFVLNKPPIMVFQRELLEVERTDKIQPLDYLNWLPEHGNDNKEDFLNRPLSVSFNFGRSNEARMWFHGAVFQNAGRFGYDVISEFSHVNKALKEPGLKWLSVHAPHYARIDAREVQNINQKALITVILQGAGVRTFRLGECCGDGPMAMPRHRLAQTYPWNEGNSIVLPEMRSIEDANESVKVISDALMDRERLYEIYCAAMNNALNFRPETYMRRVAQKIEQFV